jgi:hypothetical protein
MVGAVNEDPFIPQWTRNQKGMQGDPLEDPEVLKRADQVWRGVMGDCIHGARELHALGIHKQDCNRLLEPFAWTTQILTMTRPDNFFALRTHRAADPHFRTIARMMYLAMIDAVPDRLDYGEWHLPFTPRSTHPASGRSLPFSWVAYLDKDSRLIGELPPQIKVSAARCAWVSYENHDKDASYEACERTFSRLLAEIPVHASPVEHQLTPLRKETAEKFPNLISNCKGWLQARKLIAHENVEVFSPAPEEVASWREEVRPWYRKGGD